MIKKTIFVTILACIVCGFSSCNYYSPKEVIYESNFKTLDLIVNASDWRMDDGFCYCAFEIPELTSYIYNFGTITCYREYNHGYPDAIQFPLPQTIHNEDSKGNKYTTTIDFLYGIGYVEIGITNSNFINYAQEDMYFRLNMVW